MRSHLGYVNFESRNSLGKAERHEDIIIIIVLGGTRKRIVESA